MAEIQKADVSIFGNLNTQKPMSLADMLNISKSSYELSKLKELYPAMIAGEQARSETAQTQARIAKATEIPTVAKSIAESNEAQLKNNLAHFNNIIKGGSDLLSKPDLTKEDIIQRYVELHRNGPNADNPVALKQALMGLPESGSSVDYKKFIISNMSKTLDNQQQFEKMFPAVTMTDVGGKLVPIASGNPYVAAIAPGTIAGQGIQLGLPPTTSVVNEQTGRKELVGGVTTELSPIEKAQQDVASKDYAQNKKIMNLQIQRLQH